MGKFYKNNWSWSNILWQNNFKLKSFNNFPKWRWVFIAWQELHSIFIVKPGWHAISTLGLKSGFLQTPAHIMSVPPSWGFQSKDSCLPKAHIGILSQSKCWETQGPLLQKGLLLLQDVLQLWVFSVLFFSPQDLEEDLHLPSLQLLSFCNADSFRSDRAGTVQPWEEKAQKGSYQCI